VEVVAQNMPLAPEYCSERRAAISDQGQGAWRQSTVENAVSWKGCLVNLVQKGKLGATPEAFAVGSPVFDPRFLLFTVLSASQNLFLIFCVFCCFFPI
jgi:hypothetical protein